MGVFLQGDESGNAHAGCGLALLTERDGALAATLREHEPCSDCMICDQVHAAEDAAMQVIHDAMRSKRTVFGHSLRDTYVRATPLLLKMVSGGDWCPRYVCTMVFTGRFQGHGPGRVWAAITSGIRRGFQAA